MKMATVRVYDLHNYPRDPSFQDCQGKIIDALICASKKAENGTPNPNAKIKAVVLSTSQQFDQQRDQSTEKESNNITIITTSS